MPAGLIRFCCHALSGGGGPKFNAVRDSPASFRTRYSRVPRGSFRISPIVSAYSNMISSTRPGEKISPSLGEEFSEPIERDNQVHIEYVPTQVVTEYLRGMKTREDLSIDGIRYGSARHGGGRSLVLFCDPHNLILPKSSNDSSMICIGTGGLS